MYSNVDHLKKLLSDNGYKFDLVNPLLLPLEKVVVIKPDGTPTVVELKAESIGGEAYILYDVCVKLGLWP